MAKARAKRVALYLRVSTTDQTTENQRRELQRVAKRHGWHVVHVFADNGISGAKDRNDRPGLDALLKAVARREVDMVAAWSVDRLGRSLKNLIEVLASCTPRASTCICTSRASTRPPPPAGPCFR